MQNSIIRKKICDEVYINSVFEDKFKSDRISVNLITPLERNKATVNALVPFVMRKGCEKYPDFSLLNKKLANMYGAVLDSDVSKYADMQVIEASIQYLDDRYTINGENISKDAAELISEIIFSPSFDDNGMFKESDVEIEKDGLADTIKSELNDKRIYAINKMASLIFEGEKFGIKKYGYLEDLDSITPKKVTDAWKELISNSRIEIMCTGRIDIDEIISIFKDKLSNIERNPQSIEKSLPLAYSDYKECEEKMDIVQGKLVLGFRTGAPKTEKEKNAMRICSALYGGTPFSKLFMNVREKMSLCYYASSRYERSSGIMFVDSGIEFKNRERAQQEMLNQLDDMKNGNFTDDEIKDTVLIIKNILGMVNDSLYSIEDWYINCILDGMIMTPEEDAYNLSCITKDEIIAAAQKIKLTTVYFLKGEDNYEN